MLLSKFIELLKDLPKEDRNSWLTAVSVSSDAVSVRLKRNDLESLIRWDTIEFGSADGGDDYRQSRSLYTTCPQRMAPKKFGFRVQIPDVGAILTRTNQPCESGTPLTADELPISVVESFDTLPSGDVLCKIAAAANQQKFDESFSDCKEELDHIANEISASVNRGLTRFTIVIDPVVLCQKFWTITAAFQKKNIRISKKDERTILVAIGTPPK
jgi:hypothetical protein